MHLLVKQIDGTISEFQFVDGPIYIGRASNSQVFLPNKAVSRQHAVIFKVQNGKWTVEDLDSANKTYLNDEEIHKAEIKTGDCIRIADFTIEIALEDDTEAAQPAQLGDTFHLEASLTTPRHETVVRRPDAQHAPAMRLAAKRLSDFSQATEAISEADSVDKLLATLLDVTLRQFSAFHTWCALREQPSGPMTYQAGRRRDGSAVQLNELKLGERINQAIEKGQSMVFPRVSAQMEEKERIRSALVAAIMRPGGCFGALYVDNAMIHEHYSLSDLDYLMLLAIHTAAVLKSILR